MKILVLIFSGLAILALLYLFLNHGKVTSLIEENMIQSYQIHSLNMEVEHYKRKAETNAKNLTDMVEAVRMQVIKMDVDLFKN